MWICSKCNEEHEGQFKSCWKCGTSCDGSPADTFTSQEHYSGILNNASSKPAMSLPPMPTLPTPTRPLAILLSRYIEREIGINYLDSKEYNPAILSQVTDDYIRIYTDEKLYITYPLQQILNVVEAAEGITTGVISKKEYAVTIDVFHLVVYKGAVGGLVGFSVPIPMPSD